MQQAMQQAVQVGGKRQGREGEAPAEPRTSGEPR